MSRSPRSSVDSKTTADSLIHDAVAKHTEFLCIIINHETVNQWPSTIAKKEEVTHLKITCHVIRAKATFTNPKLPSIQESVDKNIVIIREKSVHPIDIWTQLNEFANDEWHDHIKRREFMIIFVIPDIMRGAKLPSSEKHKYGLLQEKLVNSISTMKDSTTKWQNKKMEKRNSLRRRKDNEAVIDYAKFFENEFNSVWKEFFESIFADIEKVMHTLIDLHD